MKRFGMLVLVLAAALVGGLSANAQELERWVFEGLITESSPELAPAMQSGWVMSGSFLFNGLEMEEEPVESALRAGRMSGGIHDAELTVDLYYQVQFEAVQEDGLVGFDYQDDNPDKDGRDLLGWFFPMKGKLGETGWSLTWLQVWLTHPEGKMIKHLPVAISPYGIDWQVGWFRMTYENEKREVTHVDGRIEVFSPEANLEDRDSSEQWYAVAADLSEKLVERDSTILSLRTELQEVKLRVDGLRRMVDLLVGERAELREENALLKKQADAADPAVLEKLTELEVEKSLMETELTSLTEKTSELEEALLQSELEKITLLSDFDKQPLPQVEKSESVSEESNSPRETPLGVVRIVEREPVIEQVPQEVAIDQKVDAVPESLPTRAEPRGPARRKGPRRFR
jgi:hypothetical protein